MMADIHCWTGEWAATDRGGPLRELGRIGLAVRADTLRLLSGFTGDQIASKIADHGRHAFQPGEGRDALALGPITR